MLCLLVLAVRTGGGGGFDLHLLKLCRNNATPRTPTSDVSLTYILSLSGVKGTFNIPLPPLNVKKMKVSCTPWWCTLKRMRDASTFTATSFMLQNIFWKRPLEGRYPCIYCIFCPFISMFTITYVLFCLSVCLFCSYFYCYVKINADALNVPAVSQDSRGRTNGEWGDKGSVSTFGVRQSVRLLTRSWKHGSVHVHIFRGTSKMCTARVGVQHSSSDVTPPPFYLFLFYLLPDVFETFAIISMLCFF